MSSDRLRALAALERAVAAEKEGRYDYAVPMYTQGIELLMQVVKTQTRNDDRRRLTSEIEEFMKRAERVKQLQEQRQAVGAATSSRSRSSSTSATSLLSSVASHLMPTASSLGGSRQQHLSRQAVLQLKGAAQRCCGCCAALLCHAWALLRCLCAFAATAAAAVLSMAPRILAPLTRARQRTPSVAARPPDAALVRTSSALSATPARASSPAASRAHSLPRTGSVGGGGGGSSGSALSARSSGAAAARKPAVPRQTTSTGEGDKRNSELDKIIMEELLDRSPGVVWDDIAGLAEAKQTLQEAVILPNLRPDLFTGLRAPPRGVLLYGPPGTGKTMLAKAVATESNFTFFSISASSLTSKYVGEGEKLVRALFRAARARRPSVVFVDEIDSLLSARGAGEHEASRRLKTEFMVQLDGACTGGEGDEGGLLVMGATNLPWELDEAVLRRLARRVYVPLPDGAARAALVARLLRGQSARLSKADVAAVVAASEGYSCSDLAAVTKEAAMQPLRDLGSNIRTARANQVRPITLADFERALGVITPSVAPQSLARFQRWEAGER